MSAFAELLAHPGVEEDLVLAGTFGFMAPHGGNLEGGTDGVAAAAAAAAGASLYAVRQPPDLRWHIPSTQVVPSESATLATFLDHVEVAIAVHGYGRPTLRGTILVGGRNRELASAVASALRIAVPVHPVIDDLDQIPRELRGLHPRNVVNLPSCHGVQLELPPSARDPAPEGLVDALASVAREWMQRQGASRSIRQPDADEGSTR
jgi:phage replication-related protein YjqB (UPF0714/DUF867 family)